MLLRIQTGLGPGSSLWATCYQPIDRTPAQIDRDIAIMKHAGFNVVRMGDLSWDSFEPAQGKFDFEWFDKIMDKMQANGIQSDSGYSGLARADLAASRVSGRRHRQPERHASSAGGALYG